MNAGPPAAPEARAELAARYRRVRAHTVALCAPLAVEDHVVQASPDASPPRWHLAHTTWFFEAFVLARYEADHRPYDARWGFLFNSYYEAVGPRHARARRGELSRPTVAEIGAWRGDVDARIEALLAALPDADLPDAAALLTLGLHHEQQHQELILMDVKANFAANPLQPAYAPAPAPIGAAATALSWVEVAGGLVEIGFDGPGFAFDNERPRHRAWLEPYRLASRPVSCGEYRAFIDDGGYDRAELWLSDGWAWRQALEVAAPLYWQRDGAGWAVFTLSGRRPVDPGEPVCHVSAYEADAYARWAGARLPSEAEWEHALAGSTLDHGGGLHPAARTGDGPLVGAGEVWEWTRSAYGPYPGYKAPAGALGEYNGKFMANQLVLRGGCCATPAGHTRATYRNFYYPKDRWPFTGIRLAADAG